MLHQRVTHVFEGFLLYQIENFCFFPKLSERQILHLQHEVFVLRCERSFVSFLSVSENVFTCQISHVRENPDCGLKSFFCHVSN